MTREKRRSGRVSNHVHHCDRPGSSISRQQEAPPGRAHSTSHGKPYQCCPFVVVQSCGGAALAVAPSLSLFQASPATLRSPVRQQSATPTSSNTATRSVFDSVCLPRCNGTGGRPTPGNWRPSMTNGHAPRAFTDLSRPNLVRTRTSSSRRRVSSPRIRDYAASPGRKPRTARPRGSTTRDRRTLSKRGDHVAGRPWFRAPCATDALPCGRRTEGDGSNVEVSGHPAATHLLPMSGVGAPSRARPNCRQRERKPRCIHKAQAAQMLQHEHRGRKANPTIQGTVHTRRTTSRGEGQIMVDGSGEHRYRRMCRGLDNNSQPRRRHDLRHVQHFRPTFHTLGGTSATTLFLPNQLSSPHPLPSTGVKLAVAPLQQEIGFIARQLELPRATSGLKYNTNAHCTLDLGICSSHTHVARPGCHVQSPQRFTTNGKLRYPPFAIGTCSETAELFTSAASKYCDDQITDA
ncbi:hypothetical protein BKA63DRAFT_190618 [Paraphoma chrysanthemicola]|nr:hypothetical protein BKA63DRAFT_190618 [Paraphoma chrysanthemicola]